MLVAAARVVEAAAAKVAAAKADPAKVDLVVAVVVEKEKVAVVAARVRVVDNPFETVSGSNS